MAQLQSIVFKLKMYAESSSLKARHAACILGKGGKILSIGINSDRTRVNKQTCCSMHAEQAAIKHYKGHWRKESRILWM